MSLGPADSYAIVKGPSGMNKISVLDTIRSAYAFTFGQIGTIIGLVWLPTLLLAVLQFLPYAIGTSPPSPDADPGAAGTAVMLNFAFFAGGAVLTSMNYVSVTRQALGMREGPATIHFSLGLPEWRMLASLFLCVVLLVTIIGLFAGAVLLLSAFLHAMPFAAMCMAILTLAGMCGFVYIVVRLVFLIAPVVVAEEKIDLVRAWTLTAKNFWRIFAVMLCVILPFIILQIVALALIAGPDFFAHLPPNMASAATVFAQRLQALDRHMPAIIGLSLVLAPFSLGLNLGAEAAVYRALVPAKGQMRAG
jgi:hypothetical protein